MFCRSISLVFSQQNSIITDFGVVPNAVKIYA
jgi:hypothetical protein